MGEPVHPGRRGVLEWHRRGQKDLHRLKQFGAVGLMRVMPGLGDLDRHGFGDAVREGTMVVGRDVRSHRMPDVYDVARIGFIDDFRMFGGVTG
jgi:hypothetical protein